MRRLQQQFNFAVFLLAALLTGCATFGFEKAEGFTDRAAYTRSGLNAALQTTINAVTAGTITSGDAQSVRNLGGETHEVLTSAEIAFTAGDVSTAEGRLALARGILTQLQAYLASRGVK